ncbi:MAG: DEAD/DEAH box helicase, partial [Armatimonadota bacterium]
MAGILNAIKRVVDPNEREVARLERMAEQVMELEDEMSDLSNEELCGKTAEFKQRLEDGETLDDLLFEAFAVVREVAWRQLKEKPYKVQVIGGIAMHEGMVAEMKTGEGKTLTATMPLYLNALEGKGAHLVTTNDYLVRWQAEWMGQVFRALDMTVGHIQHTMRSAERRAMYQKDITYVENSELGFDYLRDNMANSPRQLRQRELHYCIVDEADSILIDEARTPLIISGPVNEQADKFYAANNTARALKR